MLKFLDKHFKAYNVFRIIIISFILIRTYNKNPGLGGIIHILVLLIAFSAYVHLRLTKTYKNWTIFLMPITFAIISYILFTIFNLVIGYSSFTRTIIPQYTLITLGVAVLILLEKSYKKLRHVMYVITLIIIIGLLFVQQVGILLVPQNYQIDITKYQNCTKDSECIPINTGCCGCADQSINSKYNEEIGAKIRNQCSGQMCLAVLDDRFICSVEPKCIDNKCVKKVTGPEMCDKRPDKERCYYSIAAELNDPSICNLINRSQYQLENCITNVAKRNYNVLACDELEDSESCKNNVYSMLAYQNQDYKICQKMPGSKESDECIKSQATSKYDETICEEIINITIKNDCISDVFGYRAIIKSDVKLCEKVTISKSKDHCYSELARIEKDGQICQKIQNESVKLQCNIQVAKYTGDYNVCLEITDTREKDNCLWSTTTLSDIGFEKTIKICDFGSTKNWKDRCIEETSVKYLNNKYCDEITSTYEYSGGSMKDKCFERVSYLKKDKWFG